MVPSLLLLLLRELNVQLHLQLVMIHIYWYIDSVFCTCALKEDTVSGDSVYSVY